MPTKSKTPKGSNISAQGRPASASPNPEWGVTSCPFCGAEPEIQSQLDLGTNIKFWSISCINGNCPVLPIAFGDTGGPAEAVRNWNTRGGFRRFTIKIKEVA